MRRSMSSIDTRPGTLPPERTPFIRETQLKDPLSRCGEDGSFSSFTIISAHGGDRLVDVRPLCRSVAHFTRIDNAVAAREQNRRLPLKDRVCIDDALANVDAQTRRISERLVVWRHALPNAIAPAIQVTALNLAYLAGGIVVVERVFGYTGIGSALVDAVAARDFPVVQAVAMLIAAVYVVLNLAADVSTILVSPRLRTPIT